MKKHLRVIKSNADTDQQGSISRSCKLKLKQDLGFQPGDNISFEKLAERIQY